MVSIVVALAFLVASLVAALRSGGDRAGTWLPLHLAMAGGASTAIAGLMPFFSAAFAAAPPADIRLRWLSLAGVAAGAAIAAAGFATGSLGTAALGGALFVTGLVLVGAATLLPLRNGLGPRGGIVTAGYLLALVAVAMGAALAILFLLGWEPVLREWPRLRPAHAWLNLVGFVSAVIATTLLHFYPTVVGSRIVRSWSARLTVYGVGPGAMGVALGYALGSDAIARIGAIIVAIGAGALAWYASRVWQRRASWSGDPAWHRFAIGGLTSAIVWFALGMVIAVGGVLVDGADPAGAAVTPMLGPLVVGWMGFAILASATHLVPAIGPGDPARHARQRQLLGRAANGRLIAGDAGVVAMVAGLMLGSDALVLLGLFAVGLVLAASAGLILAAVGLGLASRRDRRTARE